MASAAEDAAGESDEGEVTAGVGIEDVSIAGITGATDTALVIGTNGVTPTAGAVGVAGTSDTA